MRRLLSLAMIAAVLVVVIPVGSAVAADPPLVSHNREPDS